jgi:hypothetical protein
VFFEQLLDLLAAHKPALTGGLEPTIDTTKLGWGRSLRTNIALQRGATPNRLKASARKKISAQFDVT